MLKCAPSSSIRKYSRLTKASRKWFKMSEIRNRYFLTILNLVVALYIFWDRHPCFTTITDFPKMVVFCWSLSQNEKKVVSNYHLFTNWYLFTFVSTYFILLKKELSQPIIEIMNVLKLLQEFLFRIIQTATCAINNLNS